MTLTRVFFVAGVESPRALNSVSVVYHFRPIELVVHVRFRISCFRLLIPDSRFQTVDFRFQSAGFRFQYADFAFQVPGSRLHTADRDLRFHISDSLSVKSTQATCCRRKQFFQSTLQNDCYGKLLQAGYCKQDVQHCRTPATTLCTECAEWSTSKPWTGCSALSVSASITPVTLIPRRRSKVRMSTFL